MTMSVAIGVAFVLLGAVSSCRGSKNQGPSVDARASQVAETVGVPECDEYLAKYEACVTVHVPDDKRKAFHDGLAQRRAAWRTMSENPGTRPGLAQACRLALDTARSSMQS